MTGYLSIELAANLAAVRLVDSWSSMNHSIVMKSAAKVVDMNSQVQPALVSQELVTESVADGFVWPLLE